MPSPHLKDLKDQVIAITGASSGIGFATAELAAERGARVALIARSGNALNALALRISGAGKEAIACVCDVSDFAQVEGAVNDIIARWGRIDTWVNNAGVSIYGRLDEVSDADSRRLFDTNFWGVCNGSLAVLPELKRHGGALINVGSEVSDAVVPLQGMYCASKHAVKGFTDALRIEIEEIDKSPVSITLIQPTAVNTPFPQHARNYMAQEPKLPTPMIDPKQVAEAILDAATSPTRATRVGTMAKLNTMMFKNMPSVAEKIAAKQVDRQQYDEAPRDREGALFRPSEATTVVGQAHGPGGIEEK